MHKTKAIVVTCMDFRLQKFIEDWCQNYVGEKNYDRVAWAGAAKDLDNILKQIELSKKLHDISEVYLINHENCGAYGTEATFKNHEIDLMNAKNKIEETYPSITVFPYYLHLDGTFQEVR